MECGDTLLEIVSYLTKKDLVVLSGVSRLCRTIISGSCLSREEKQYLVWPCLKEEFVELAPPSQILALGLLEREQRLLALIRCGTDTARLDELECYLYCQVIDEDGSVTGHQCELPSCFALPTSLVRFEGSRFLMSNTREGELHVFDCLVEAMLELPVGVDGFYASPNGDRFLLDHNRYAFFCSAGSHIDCWWEMTRVDRKRQGPTFDISSHSSPPALVATRLRAKVGPLPEPERSRALAPPDPTRPVPPLCYCLDTSSSAWRTFWLGSYSALYASEDGVSLLRAATPQEVTPLPLPALSSSYVDMVHSSCGDVAGTSRDCHDEYAVINCREMRLHTVSYWPTRQPAMEVRTIELNSVVPSRAVLRHVCIVVQRSTYLVYMQLHGQDRVLLLSSDLTLTRWVSIGQPSCFVLWRERAALITASLPADEGDSNHPLVEAVEGGLGCVYSFGLHLAEASPTAPIDPFTATIKMTSAVGGVDAGEGMLQLLRHPQSFNGVEALSWMALGVVSASLVWTVSALCYNGWWLHFQLLFWGKVA